MRYLSQAGVFRGKGDAETQKPQSPIARAGMESVTEVLMLVSNQSCQMKETI